MIFYQAVEHLIIGAISAHSDNGVILSDGNLSHHLKGVSVVLGREQIKIDVAL